MAALIIKDRALGVYGRRLVTDVGGAPCCCGGGGPCCDPLPLIGCAGVPIPGTCCHCGIRYRVDFYLTYSAGHDITGDPFLRGSSMAAASVAGRLFIRCGAIEGFEFDAFRYDQTVISTAGRVVVYALDLTNATGAQLAEAAEIIRAASTCGGGVWSMAGGAFSLPNWFALQFGLARLIPPPVGFEFFRYRGDQVAANAGSVVFPNVSIDSGDRGAVASVLNQIASEDVWQAAPASCPQAWTYTARLPHDASVVYNGIWGLSAVDSQGGEDPTIGPPTLAWTGQQDCRSARFRITAESHGVHTAPNQLPIGTVTTDVDFRAAITTIEACSPDPCPGVVPLTPSESARIIAEALDGL